MTVSKRFRWEAAHRLPWHEEACKHLHGHSYVMWIGFDGTPDERGMVIDFKGIKDIVKPLVESWDHSILVSKQDEKLLEAVSILESKHYVFPYDTTSENLCSYVIDYLLRKGQSLFEAHRIQSLTVRVQETETCYAELHHTIDY